MTGAIRPVELQALRLVVWQAPWQLCEANIISCGRTNLQGGGDLAGGAAGLEGGVVGHGVGRQLASRLPHGAQQHQRLQCVRLG